MLTTQSTCDDGDSIVNMDTSWGFQVLADPESYRGFLGEWTCRSIADMALRQMNQEKLLAWGTPEGHYSFKFHCGKRLQRVSHRQFEGCIHTTGTLCLASFGSVTMCAQFEDYKLPQPQDYCIQVAPGRYHVTVQQLFRWRGGGQLPSDDYPGEMAEGLNYYIAIRPARSQRSVIKPRIALASWMYAAVE
jgi:hypothetical protein